MFSSKLLMISPGGLVVTLTDWTYKSVVIHATCRLFLFLKVSVNTDFIKIILVFKGSIFHLLLPFFICCFDSSRRRLFRGFLGSNISYLSNSCTFASITLRLCSSNSSLPPFILKKNFNNWTFYINLNTGQSTNSLVDFLSHLLFLSFHLHVESETFGVTTGEFWVSQRGIKLQSLAF